MPEHPPFWLLHPVSVPYFITSDFNDGRSYGKHEGIDLRAIDSAGRPANVLAAQRGVVEKVETRTDGYGKYIRIRHDWPDGSTYVTWYGHLSDFSVQVGEFVTAGQKIGVAGQTGNATGIHLHLTLQHLGHGLSGYWLPDVVDPKPYIRFSPPAAGPEAMLLADVTIPPGMILLPGTPFTKTWRLINSGSVPWGADFELVFIEGQQMGGPATLPLPAAQPGQQVEVSLSLTAPSAGGRQRGVWQPRDATGKFFDFPQAVEIVVAGSGVTDDARFLADVTIPDGSRIPAGQPFLKTWRVRNTGSTTWEAGYALAYVADERLSAPYSVPIPRTAPGQEAEVSITLTAPPDAGSYRSTWRLRNAAGLEFGDILWALITVEAAEPAPKREALTVVADGTYPPGSRVTAGADFQKIWRVRNSGEVAWGAGYQAILVEGQLPGAPATLPLPALAVDQVADLTLNLQAPVAAGPLRLAWRPRNPAGSFFDEALPLEVEVVAPLQPGQQIDDARFVADVTILDGSVITAGSSFLKTWRVRNTGSTTWTQGYALAYAGSDLAGDDPMSAGPVAAIPVVAPGEEADLSLRLVAPLNPGVYQSTWRLQNGRGEFFGEILYTIIRVPSAQPAPMDNRAVFVGHETIPNGTVLLPGQKFEKIWLVRNIGTSEWGAGYTLAFQEGERLGAPESVPVPLTIPQKTARLKVNMKAPGAAGTYKGYWKLRDPRGQTFGPRLLVHITVRKK